MVVGYEVAGTIDAVGEGIDEGRLGEPVVAMCRFGGYASQVVVPASQAVRRPEGMDAATAAAIPVQALTAWMMTEVYGRVRAGDRVLVHSAGGGVGLMALELLEWRGATAVGTASAHKHAFLAERGYDQLIDYRTQDYAEVLEDQEGFDLVLDPLGGENWAKGLKLLRPGGRLICFGFSKNAEGRSSRSVFATLGNFLAVPWLKFNPLWLINNNVGVCGVNLGHLWTYADTLSEWLTEILALWEQGRLRVQIHAQVPFSTAAEAHRILHDRENLGKVLLLPGQ